MLRMSKKATIKRGFEGSMFGSFSFINVGLGKEEFGDGHSPKNIVEVAVISDIISKLFKGILLYHIKYIKNNIVCVFFSKKYALHVLGEILCIEILCLYIYIL